MNQGPRYIILVGERLGVLENLVNQCIENGYLPCGGFFTELINDQRWFYQPMLREPKF